MPLAESLSLIASYKQTDKVFEKSQILAKLSLNHLSEGPNFVPEPETLIKALETYTKFIIEDIRPFQRQGEEVRCTEVLADGGLKMLLGMTELSQLLTDRVPPYQIQPPHRERIAAIIKRLWNHLQFLVQIRSGFSIQFQNNREGCVEAEVKDLPVCLLQAYILMECAHLAALDRLVEKSSAPQNSVNDPLLIVDLACPGLIPNEIARACCHGCHLRCTLVHAYLDRALVIVKDNSRISLFNLTRIISRTSAEAKDFFYCNRIMTINDRALLALKLLAFLVLFIVVVVVLVFLGCMLDKAVAQ